MNSEREVRTMAAILDLLYYAQIGLLAIPVLIGFILLRINTN